MDLELKILNQFTGSLNYYNVWGVKITDGIKYVMDNGYSWFITDSIAVIISKFKDREFLVVKLDNLEDNECDMIIEDGDSNVLYKQHYKFTDAKRKIKVYYSEGVLLLPSEW